MTAPSTNRPDAPFAACIGVDYSGAGEPDRPCPGLAVAIAEGEQAPALVHPQPATGRRTRVWSRAGLAQWLETRLTLAADRSQPVIVGIDHALGLPHAYLTRHRIERYDRFLDDLVEHWPCDRRTVEACRAGNPRGGSPDELRLTERWAHGSASVFRFDVQGSVAKSTFAGLPWIRQLRRRLQDGLFVWPFDGWTPPPDVSVLAEVFPTCFRRRFAPDCRTPHERDALVVAAWLQRVNGRGELGRYLDPPLTPDERQIAGREGWILGVT